MPAGPSTVAMHMSDGIVNAPTSLAFAAVALLAMGVAASRARAELDERTAPMAGLVAAFVFAVQMVNFPIFPGVSGHLLGGALAAILVGPYTGALCVGIVLVVQSLLFADGGITALGTNITNMAVIGVVVGYGTAVLLRPLLARRGTRGIAALAFIAALVNTLVASMGFVAQYALGGAAEQSVGTVLAFMAGTHTLIGVGEGIITALTVTAVAAARPDLVHLLRTAPAPARPAGVPA